VLACEVTGHDGAVPASRPRRNTRPRDALGRPLPYGSAGVDQLPEGLTRTPAQTFAEAARLLAAGRPFHAHEVFEDAWKSGPDNERELWRGLAQLAVGITHAARGNAVGADALLERGARNLVGFAADPPHGLDIAALLAWTARAREQVAQACPTTLPAPPFPSQS
jgi:hypothetical protein